MEIEEFENLFERKVRQLQQILIQKNREYSKGNDKLYNFKRASEILRCSPFKALQGMKTKHDVSLLDIIDRLDKGEKINFEMLEEKINDSINYLILLEALCIDLMVVT